LKDGGAAFPEAGETFGQAYVAAYVLAGGLPPGQRLSRHSSQEGVAVSAFLISFAVIFLAELGDKSQLVALWFATKYRWWIVLAGVTAATLVVHLGSVYIGRTIDAVLSEDMLLIVVGISFFVFAAWSIRGDRLTEDPSHSFPLFGSFGIVATSFFLSELGDKTQLATVTLAGDRPEIVGVWLGSTAGMVAADALAIAAGIIAGKRLPRRTIGVAAAALFVVFGVIAIGQAVV
jgi:putative Ca2+/H+ antiporter (TMEM165/GDT1 family)